jgi:hypothetical protein
MFENRVLKTGLGSTGEDITAERKKLHKEEHHDLYTSPNIIPGINSRKLRWARHVARMGERKSDGKRPLATPSRR